MKTEIPKKVIKMMFDMSEVAKTQTMKNVISAAIANDIKITHEDLQKLTYIVNSSIDTVCINSTKNFETRLAEMVEHETNSKSSEK